MLFWCKKQKFQFKTRKLRPATVPLYIVLRKRWTQVRPAASHPPNQRWRDHLTGSRLTPSTPQRLSCRILREKVIVGSLDWGGANPPPNVSLDAATYGDSEDRTANKIGSEPPLKGGLGLLEGDCQARALRPLSVLTIVVALAASAEIGHAQSFFDDAEPEGTPICRTCVKPAIIYGDDVPVVPLPPALPMSLAAFGALWFLHRSRNRP